MLTVIQGEDGEQRERRARRQEAQQQEVIRERDVFTTPSHAENIAHAQLRNQAYRRPLDYAAIIEGRKVRPELFDLLPSDDVCRAALGEPVEAKPILKLKK